MSGLSSSSVELPWSGSPRHSCCRTRVSAKLKVRHCQPFDVKAMGTLPTAWDRAAGPRSSAEGAGRRANKMQHELDPDNVVGAAIAGTQQFKGAIRWSRVVQHPVSAWVAESAGGAACGEASDTGVKVTLFRSG